MEDLQIQQYIKSDDTKWFNRYSRFLAGKILKVGNGSGFASGLIEQAGFEIETIDVEVTPGAINKESVILYDGQKFPFQDRSFECVVCTYVLHHTPNPTAILSEMSRVAKRIILLEETYTNLAAKLNLIRRDYMVNKRAAQPYRIYWSSFFSRKSLTEALRQFKTVHHQTEKKQNYLKELYVVDKIKT